MIILGIETSCDETAASVLVNGAMQSNIISIQDIHCSYGGVVPEFASRAHQRLIIPVIRAALSDAGISLSDLNGIAVTYGPGLVGSIIVGLNCAKGLAFGLAIPFIGVNHIEGHIFANFIEAPYPELPFLCLIISGGHTQLVLVEELGCYRILGRTIDDAAGEAFDKVARVLDLGYPGGPAIQRVSEGGDPEYIRFPRAMMEEGNLNFSFSGLKTAVLYYVKNRARGTLDANLRHIAASFEYAVADVVVRKTMRAAEAYSISHIALAGGVAANSRLRAVFSARAKESGRRLYIPPHTLCTDNAAMVARAGQYYFEKSIASPFDLGPNPSLTL